MSRHVAMLMGGLSVEREVSLVTGAACAAALEEEGFEVSRVDVDGRLPATLCDLKPDVCFNALHGKLGEDGRVQGLLDLMAIPYTHSGVLASAIAMDKPMAKKLFTSDGLLCPEGVVMSLAELLDGGPPFPGAIVAKPAAEGSSIGVFILHDGDLRPLRERNDVDLSQRMLVERYLPGRELTVAVLDDEPLAVTEISPREGFFDYRAKYSEGFADHLIPAPVPDDIHERALAWGLRAHRLLGCRGVSRTDFRYDPSAEPGGELFALEINTQPGMTPLSLVPEQAAYRGISFGALLRQLVETAQCDR